MNQTYSSDSLKYLFRYPFQGKEWGRKMLYLALFWLAGYIIPVVPWVFALGYFAEILRRMALNETDTGLPDWTDWNSILLDGVRVLGAGLIVSLPIVVLFTTGMSYYMGSTFALAGLSDSGRDLLGLLTLSSGMVVLFCTMALVMVLSVAAGLCAGPAITHMVVEKKFAAFFRIGEWGKVLRANLGGYLIGIFLILGLGFVVQLASQFAASTLILCGLLPILWAVSTPYLSVISAVVFGQAYREGQDTLSAAADELAVSGD